MQKLWTSVTQCSKLMVLKEWSTDQQHQYPIRICYKSKFGANNTDLMSQKLWR